MANFILIFGRWWWNKFCFTLRTTKLWV